MNEKINVWIYKNILAPRWEIPLFFTFSAPLRKLPIHDILFALHCICPTHLRMTQQYDEWRTRRWCKFCQYYWDLG